MLEVITVPLICKVESFPLAKLALPVIGTEKFEQPGLIQNWGLVAWKEWGCQKESNQHNGERVLASKERDKGRKWEKMEKPGTWGLQEVGNQVQ